jgi:GMP synthase-like glutamine amidotransferase
MRAHYIQHVPYEGLGRIAGILKERDITLRGTHLYRGDSLPDLWEVNMLIIMGGPMGVHDERQYAWMRAEKEFISECIELGKKVIGVCLGAQLIADCMGAPVTKNAFREIGWFPVRKTAGAEETDFGRILPAEFQAFHWHGDTFGIPEGAVRLCGSEACENQAFSYENRVLGLQFHCESTPESVSELVKNCGNDLDGSRWVQGADELLKDGHFESSNLLMGNIFDCLLERPMKLLPPDFPVT